MTDPIKTTYSKYRTSFEVKFLNKKCRDEFSLNFTNFPGFFLFLRIIQISVVRLMSSGLNDLRCLDID